MQEKNKTATFANGCFWCTEAVFQRFKGIDEVYSGYTGGKIKNPAYREVAMGLTGHAEAIQFEYNPETITYKELLEVFFTTHDPTTLNRQGNDVGTQYRSAIYYTSNEQKEAAEGYIEWLTKNNVFDDPIVTEVKPLEAFYRAEEEHHVFYNRNKEMGYCQYIINPKIDKIRKHYQHKLKEEYTH